jgi:glycosyltransferase involved in cell wall biosynthesis
LFGLFERTISSFREYPISLIISAKNESDNLKLFIPHIISQNYSDFELILVNDNSTDNTLKVMQSLKRQYSNIDITIINIISENFKGNKKIALTKAIHQAKNNYLVFTDADCKPTSQNWLKTIASKINNEKTIFLGYGAYRKINWSWLNKLIRFETLLTAIQYFSYAKIGIPYMGVGRNIAYKKSVFNDAKGFIAHQHIKSGDDDLFINQVANAKNTTYSLSNDSFTVSEPHTNFLGWFHQKRRHITTSNHYKPIHQFLLVLFYLSQILFWFLSIFLLINAYLINFVLLLFFIRIGLQYITYGISSYKLKETDLIIFIPFLELFLIIIQMSIFIRNLISKPKHW